MSPLPVAGRSVPAAQLTGSLGVSETKVVTSSDPLAPTPRDTPDIMSWSDENMPKIRQQLRQYANPHEAVKGDEEYAGRGGDSEVKEDDIVFEVRSVLCVGVCIHMYVCMCG